MQQPAAQIPWFHNCAILDKVKLIVEREWYIRQTIEQGWSRNVLVHLRCFVAIDLKVEAFKLEFSGKMSFYVSAVDDLLKHRDDLPTIGIILCKHKKQKIVEYSLRDTNKPIGVSTYQLRDALPEKLQGSLPSIAQLEAELAAVDAENEE